MVWHGDAWRSAILIDASLSNDALNAVAVSQSLAQSLEHNSSYTFLQIGRTSALLLKVIV